MWRFLVAAAIVLSVGEAQRSSYAPRPGSNSKLLARYRKNQTSTEASLGTRLGEESNSVSTNLPPELQGTLEDQSFVQRVSQWPEDRQPFWFKNRYAISNMRGQEIDGGNVNLPSSGNQRRVPEFQSSFLGPSRTRSSQTLSRPSQNENREQEYFQYANPLPSYFRRTNNY